MRGTASRLALAALLLTAREAPAQPENLHPHGGGGPVQGIPWPMEFGGTGSSDTSFLPSRCVETYADLADLDRDGNPKLKMRSTGASCGSGGAVDTINQTLVTGNCTAPGELLLCTGPSAAAWRRTPTPAPTPSQTPVLCGTPGFLAGVRPEVCRTPAPSGIQQVGDCTGSPCFDLGTLDSGEALTFWDVTGGSGFGVTVDPAPLTDHRTQQLPDRDGTFVVACQVPLICSNGQVAIGPTVTPTPTVTVTPTPTVTVTPPITADRLSVDGVEVDGANFTGGVACLPGWSSVDFVLDATANPDNVGGCYLQPTPLPTITLVPADRGTPGILAPVTPAQVVNGRKALPDGLNVGPTPSATPTSAALYVSVPQGYVLSEANARRFFNLEYTVTADTVTSPLGPERHALSWTASGTSGFGSSDTYNFIDYPLSIDWSAAPSTIGTVRGANYDMTFTRDDAPASNTLMVARYHALFNHTSATGSGDLLTLANFDFTKDGAGTLSNFFGLRFNAPNLIAGTVTTYVPMQIENLFGFGGGLVIKSLGSLDSGAFAGKLFTGNSSPGTTGSAHVGMGADGIAPTTQTAGTASRYQSWFTNRTGATSVVGNLVIVDTANNNSYVCTTTNNSGLVLGVVGSAVTNTSAGRVVTNGTVSVTCTGTCNRGEYVSTSTTSCTADCSAAHPGAGAAIGIATSTCSGSLVTVALDKT